MLMHTHTISFNYPPITNDCLYPAPQYILWNCCVYPRGRDVRLRNTLPCTVYEVLEYMSVLHETFVTRLTHYPVFFFCQLPGSSGTRHVRCTHPDRLPGTSGSRYAHYPISPCTDIQRAPETSGLFRLDWLIDLIDWRFGLVLSNCVCAYQKPNQI